MTLVITATQPDAYAGQNGGKATARSDQRRTRGQRVTNANQCRNTSSEKSDPAFGKTAISGGNGNCIHTAFFLFCQEFN